MKAWLCAGVNAYIAATNVTAQNNAGGFTGGGMHLQNTQHLQPGVPLSGITVMNNTCAFAGGFAVFGGVLCEQWATMLRQYDAVWAVSDHRVFVWTP